MGSNSKDLLSAVLRAEADLDHLVHATDYANEEDEEAEATTLEDASLGKKTPGAVQDFQKPPLPTLPTRLIIEDENAYEENLPESSRRQNLNHEDSEDSDEDGGNGGSAYDPTTRLRQRDRTPSVKERERERGRYLSLASTRSQPPLLGFPLRTPATPTRRGRREDVLVPGALASPLARSFSQARRPLSAVVGSNSQTYLGAGSNNGGAGGASNDDVLAALKRLEATIATNGKEGKSGEVGKAVRKDSKSETGAAAVAVENANVLKELGERQTRIEALLLSLTREMRS